ncbi:MAG TPA: class I SAM-dependent methyltransferase [Kineosporiaceae bacterium]|nr:class I SAM-dependent methyltransferase [Kineosporiaceae bacterium]
MRIRPPGHLGHRHGHNSFEGQAAHYDLIAGRLMRRPYRRMAVDAAAGLPPGACVLDVGAGPGGLLVQLGLLRPDLRLTGVDLASDMVATARDHLARFGDRATAVVGDVAELPFGDAMFDLVVSTLSLHHWADPVAGGREVARVLRPGGTIRIYDVRSAPFAALRTGVAESAGAGAAEGAGSGAGPDPFPITPLPRPALRRLVLSPDGPARS